MSDTKTMNKALVDIFYAVLKWETDLPIRGQILKLAKDAIPTTAQIMIAFSKEQALKARTERLEKALRKLAHARMYYSDGSTHSEIIDAREEAKAVLEGKVETLKQSPHPAPAEPQ